MNSVRPADHQLPRAGDIVAGKYKVESVIGTGGMGVVLGAEDTSLGRRVAIKFLAPHKARNEGAVARFVREARAAASIQSEHVVRVFEVSTLPNGASYIVMEHLAGGDLSQVLGSRGPLPMQEAVDYLLQACEAIGEAHGRGIVHRDLKPQNLFVTQSPDGSACVKVLDFGISKAIDEDAPNLTATDAVMGTPLYMSPEQVRSLKNVDLRSDIWALGAILFELLTASPIFECATVTALCAAIAMDPPTPLRVKRPDAPAELEAVILRCLHKDARGRYEDVAALADALAPFASERGRVSVALISRVVRSAPQQGIMGGGAPPQAAYAATGGTTGGTGSGPYPMVSQSFVPPAPASYPHASGGHSNYPPGAVAAQGYTAYGQQMQAQYAQQRSTQETWQHQTGAMGGKGSGQQQKAGSALFAILGVVAGLFLLAIIAGAGIFYYSQKSQKDAATAQADAGAAAAATAAAAAAATSAAPVAAAGATGTAAVAAAGAKPKNTGAVAAAGAKSAAASASIAPTTPGSAAPSGGPAPASSAEEEAARIARARQIAQGRCSLLAQQLRTNDASNSGARSVKNQACIQASSMSPNSGSSSCERSHCRTACTILKDQICLMQLDNAERNNPLKF